MQNQLQHAHTLDTANNCIVVMSKFLHNNELNPMRHKEVTEEEIARLISKSDGIDENDAFLLHAFRTLYSAVKEAVNANFYSNSHLTGFTNGFKHFFLMIMNIRKTVIEKARVETEINETNEVGCI